MLKDETLDIILEQFSQKNEILAQYGEQVSAATLYEDIFGDTDLEMPIVIIDEDTDKVNKHIVTMSISEAIMECSERNDMLMGGCTYFNNWISKKSAKDIYSFIIDMDNVYSGVLNSALRADWKTASGEQLPKPTYIVNSGTGLHLYFVLTEPIPNYKLTTENLDKLYRALAVGQTTKRVYLRQQVQWFGQDFRMAGGKNKYNEQNTVFRVGDKWDIDELGRAVGLKDVHFVRYGEPRQKKPQEIIRAKRNKGKGWYSNRAFYDYALKNCEDKTKEGNRYTSMCALSVIAWKCAVPMSELERDLLSLLPTYNKDATRIIKEKEVYSAIKMYNERAMLTQRERLEHWQGWEYKPIKRREKPLKQAVHLRLARNQLALMKEMGIASQGRPQESGTKKQIVLEWRSEHPSGTKSECHRDTGLSRTTIGKWWNSVAKSEQYSCTTEIICRGCTIGDRKHLWYGLKTSNADTDGNTYLTFEPEPTNPHDSNAVKVVFRGELFGTAGYVGKEYTAEVKEILASSDKYVIELDDEKQIGNREITLKVRWNNE